MRNETKTKEQLINKVAELRQQIAELEAAESEHKQAEESLRKSEARLRSVISSIDDLVFVLDRSGVFLDYYSPGSVSDLHVPPELFLGKSFQDILPPPVVKLAETAINAVLTTNKTQQFDYPLDIAGRECWFSAKVSLRKDGDGEFAGVTIVSRNITKRVRAQKALQQHTKRLRILTTQRAEVLEAERQRLARELHDRVGQNLTALGINLNILRAQTPGEAGAPLRSRLDDSLLLVEQTTEQIRDVMAELRPPLLDDYGLVAALHWYGEQFARRTEIAITVAGEDPIPRPATRIENVLFRIAQEALTNVTKHAQATQVRVIVEVDGGTLRLIIADNGHGFDPAPLAEPDGGWGWGLLTMAERAEAVGGRGRVESKPGQGTQIIVEVPR